MTKLWMLTGFASGYDTYDSCVVAAETEEEAKKIHPSDCDFGIWHNDTWCCSVWVPHVTCEFIGTTEKYKPGTVVLASFNAG